MMNVLLFAVSFLFMAVFFPTRGVDYESKSVLKEIQKVTGVEKPEWQELVIPELSADADPVQGKFFVITINRTQNQKKYVYIGRVNSCRMGGCSNGSDMLTLDNSEYFDYLIVYSSAPSVEMVKVYNYQASHGQEMTNKGWLKQFQGYNGTRNLTVGKSIDAISGATTSVQSITADIQQKTQLLKKMVQ
jgi:hypothetical protein